MSSPEVRTPRHHSFVHHHQDDASPFALPTRSGALQSIIRSRSNSSLSSKYRAQGNDEESGPRSSWYSEQDDDITRLLANEQRLSQILCGSQARSMSLIGKSNPRYRWERYWKNRDELKTMSKPVRQYYERTNDLIQQYMYIDCLLDSTIPHELLNEYSAELEASAFRPVHIPSTIMEDEPQGSESAETASEPSQTTQGKSANGSYGATDSNGKSNGATTPQSLPQKRTPKDIFRSSEEMPLLAAHHDSDNEDEENPGVASPLQSDGSGPKPRLPWLEDAELDSDSPIVTLAIWVNFVANGVLLAGKLAVVFSVPSMSVLASLVDAALDFLSTAIVWITTHLVSVSQKDQHNYPIGRRRLEPVGVLVFSVIMITCFVQVGMQCIERLADPAHEVLELGIPALSIMVGTVIIKGLVWIWCRLVKNSSVQALAEDCKTDVVFNTGSILFPIIGSIAQIWWLDAVGGLLLSLYVVFQWSQTTIHHIRNLSGLSAEPDERNLLLYLTMRFATTIRRIQNLRAYHAGDKLVVEVDIVLPANMPLKDSHDLSEVLTYFLESVPIVDRAFVHVDYLTYNAPTHMLRQSAE
ncbi:unnamed protein product [Clonostachys chloroleuca]|uniref:Uncharacterized protein n=1 Tax=Clonostachys chloroleuca TaxID=1926264 RepID=A0AA35VPQ1_9HYPO|nr:unnamed protein product [Clonostachys chloroleuca]